VLVVEGAAADGELDAVPDAAGVCVDEALRVELGAGVVAAVDVVGGDDADVAGAADAALADVAPPADGEELDPVATAPLEEIKARNPEAFGAWMLAIARWALAPELTDRNPTPSGAGMTIPFAAARRSILWSSAREATLVLSSSLRLCSAVPRSIERPMPAPSFSTSTCIATIPASIKPRTAIQARPRTTRSSSA
jgi:hypothetical protein